MSVLLADLAVEMLRAALPYELVRTVQLYGGEFGAGEVPRLSFDAPAVLVAPLGWEPGTSTRLAGRHVRRAHGAAFIVAKHPVRPDRARQAAALADLVALRLRQWVPGDAGGQALTVAGLEEEPRAENLYSAAMDKQGLALWVVRWWQAVQPAPEVLHGLLVDLLRVDVDDTVHGGTVPPDAAVPGTVDVRIDVDFAPPGA